MSAGPISESERVASLERFGWSNAELIWEQIQETAAEAAGSGRLDEARELWSGALEVAREHLGADDPRLGTSLVNAGIAARLADESDGARRMLTEGLAVWESCSPWVASLRPGQTARSSTFHFRLQSKYGSRRYGELSREGYRQWADEGLRRVRSHLAGNAQGRDAYARWRTAKPAAYNDARKLLGAVLLMV